MSDRITKFSIKLLILYIFFGWFFSRTIFASSTAVYISFVVLLGLFLLSLVHRGGRIPVNRIFTAWFIYLVLTIGGYLIQTKFENFAYWFICMILVSIVPKIANYKEYINEKLLLNIGIFSCFGLLIQLFLPSFYDANIANIFLNRDVLSLASGEYGLSGFTYQMDTSAMPILYAEGIFLFYIVPKKGITQFKSLIITLVFVFCIILTGKRILMIVSIAVPVLVYVVTIKNIKKKSLFLCGSVFVMFAIYKIVIFYSAELINIPYFGRLVKALVNYRVYDISTGRAALFEKAVTLFKENPIFGIGVNNFASLSGMKTDVHNTYMQVLCEQGVVGFLPYIIGLILTFAYTVRILKIPTLSVEDKGICKFILYVQVIYFLYSLTGNLNVNMFGYCFYFLYISFLPCIENKYIQENHYVSKENC